jgi:hypothetical protein
VFSLACFTSQAILFGWLDHSSRTEETISLAQTRWESDLQKKEKAMFRNFKVLLVVLVLIVATAGAYAFAAANTVPDSAAGYAASVVPGYTVTSIVYDLDATDPTVVDLITFDISPTSGDVVAAIVKVQTAAAGSWTNCTLEAGTPPAMEVTCTYGSLDLADITALNIVASSSADPAP